jgi:LmbE family N-acetylglucosaminyl deacetylase
MTVRGASDGEPVAARSVLAVCAHPDDESFGLGAVLDTFAAQGAAVSLLCFTDGAASTLGADGSPLQQRRADELRCAAAALGLDRVQMGDHPDGHLCEIAIADLAAEVTEVATRVGADLLVVFDDGGITGHPDHVCATRAALEATPALPVLAWALAERVADALAAEFGAGFVGRPGAEIDIALSVDRSRQHRAIRCHASQSEQNPVLDRRLELAGDTESLRWLRRPVAV